MYDVIRENKTINNLMKKIDHTHHLKFIELFDLMKKFDLITFE